MEKYNEHLIDFISKKAGVSKAEINYDSKIESDLGVTGEDAEELIIQFSKLFKVDIVNFKFDKYFYAEPSLSIFLNHNNKTIETLTVGHLAKGILAGRLDDTVING